jgi:hypothetical protein
MGWEIIKALKVKKKRLMAFNLSQLMEWFLESKANLSYGYNHFIQGSSNPLKKMWFLGFKPKHQF